MATRKDSISLRIKTVVEGLQDIDKLVSQIDTLGGESTETSDEVKALNREFSQLQKQQRVIDEFNRLDASISKTERDLAKARDRASEVAQKFKAAANPTQALSREYERAADTQGRLEQQQKAQLRTLDGLSNRMKAAGVDTGRLTAEQVRLNASMARVRGQSDDLTKKLSTIRDGYLQAGTGAAEFGRKSRKAGDDAGKGFSSIADKIRNARNLVLGFFGINLGAGMVNDLIRVSDEWKNINARLKLAADSQDEFALSQAEAFRIAQASKTPLSDVANLYGRLHISLKEQETTQAQSLALTEAITKAMKVSGASTQESSATIIQLTQAMQSGVLRGQEFNSMMEQGPRLAKALADGLGMPVTALREMALSGELTSVRVRDALLSQADVINAEFAELPRTVEGAVSRLSNAWTQFIGQANDSKGATDVLAQGIESVANNLEEVANTALLVGETIAAVYAVKGVNAARLYVAELMAANAATIKLGDASVVAAGKIGKIEAAAKLAGAAFLGWEVGTFLKDQFVEVEKAGIALAAGLTETAERARYAWEVAKAAFTDDTLDAATQRHEERLRKVHAEYTALFAAAGKASTELEKSGQASDKAASGMDQAQQKAKALADENKRLAEQLALVSVLEERGVITSAAAAAQKLDVVEKLKTLNSETKNAALGEQRLKQTNEETLAVYSKKIKASTSVAQATKLLGEAVKVFGKDTESVGKLSLETATHIEGIKTKADKTADSVQTYGQKIQKLGEEYNAGNISSQEYLNGVNSLSEANEGASDSTDKVADSTENWAASLEGSMDIMTLVRNHINGLKEEVAAFGDRAVQVFEDTLRAAYEMGGGLAFDRVGVQINAAATEADRLASQLDATNDRIRELQRELTYAAGETDAFFKGTALVAEKVKAVFLDQQVSVARLTDRLKRMNGASKEQIDSLERSVAGFNLLDETDLSGVRGEISRLRSEQEALNSSIETTLRSLQDEFDQLSGNEASIQLREFQSRLQELQEQHDAARQANNSRAVQNASEAIRILRQVHAEKMRQIEKEKQAQEKTAAQASSGSQPPREVVEVRFGLASGAQAVGQFAPHDAAAFVDEMRRFKDTGMSVI